jgi:DNA-binding response OmpR family regulator
MSAGVGIVSRGEAGAALGEALLPHGIRILRHESARAALAHSGDAALLAVDATGAMHDAFDAIRQLRAQGFRGEVLALVDREDSLSAVLALEMGANAFVEMPVHPRVVGAYARRVLREREDAAVLRVGSLEIHLSSRSAYLDGTRLELPGSEFELLAALAQRAGEALSRDALCAAVGQVGSGRAIDTRVCRLRVRLANAGGPAIVTLRNRGYMLAPG